MTALIDADLVAYRCAASAGNDDEEVAILRANDLMEKILMETGSTSYHAFLTGKNNFRKLVYPEYKANRTQPKPTYLEAVQNFLRKEWNATSEENLEADDLLAMHQSEGTVLCSLDKDLLQVPGLHYNWVKQEYTEVGAFSGELQFWTQMLAGDKSDNVLGYDGVGRATIPKFITKIVDENLQTIDKTVLDLYNDKHRFLQNCIVLRMITKKGTICLPKIVNTLLSTVPEMVQEYEFIQAQLAQVNLHMELTGQEMIG